MDVGQLWVVQWCQQSNSVSTQQAYEVERDNRLLFQDFLDGGPGIRSQYIAMGFFESALDARAYADSILKRRNAVLDRHATGERNG